MPMFIQNCLSNRVFRVCLGSIYSDIHGQEMNVPQFIYLFGVLRHFQHCTSHITTGSGKGRGNQYIQFVRVLYCKLPTNGKQLPASPLEAPGCPSRQHPPFYIIYFKD